MAESAQDLAEEAFNSRRYTLAAEIYEKFISQHGPSFKTYILLADAYAKGERLKDAVDTYTIAFRLENIRPEHLRNFINALLDVMRKRRDFLPNRTASICSARNDYFSCFICRGILMEPVTIPCGHSFCRKCVVKDTSNTCKSCGVRHLALPAFNVNVSLQALVHKLFPREIESGTKKDQGNKAFAKGQFKEAIDFYTEALALSPNDHLIFGNRSNVYFKMKQYREAEIDGDNAIRLRPDWSKGYFRKAQAEAGQNKLIDAAATYLQCLLLDESREVKNHLAKVLIELLDPMSPANELKNPSGPSMGHSLLVKGLEKLLARDHQLERQVMDPITGEGGFGANQLVGKWVSNEDEESSDDGSRGNDPDWSRMEMYNILPLVVNRPSGLSRSMPLLTKSLTHFCSEASGLRYKKSSESEDALLGKSKSTDGKSKSNPDQSPSKWGVKSRDSTECISCSILKTAAALDPNTFMGEMGKRKLPRDRLEREDFECSLCLRLLWEPVTTPCGHVFCRGCLDRVTDHSTKCPLCKNDLAYYVNQRSTPATHVFKQLIKEFLPQDYEERAKLHEMEMAELARMGSAGDVPIPIFVCTLAFPSITCPLHVFEPRYRLMVRQAMETGSRQFGMCLRTNSESGPYATHGTMLEIQDVSYFPDGRSVVNTIGGRRFRVASRGMRDGYDTANVEFISDEMETEPEAQRSLVILENRVYDIAQHWFSSLPSSKKTHIANHFGAFPIRVPGEINSPHGPSWTWWEIAVLPIDQLIQLRLLATTSLRERLLTVQSLLLHFNHAMGIGPLPAHDPRIPELDQIRLNSLQGGNQGVANHLGAQSQGRHPPP